MRFENFSPDSKLWLYQSDRALSPTEITWIREQLQLFTDEWTAHGAKLKAAADVLNPYTLAIAVDLTQADASGCSIDASVRFLKSMGAELKVDFFNRLRLLLESEDGTQRLVPFRQVNDFPEDWIYNPLVETLGALQDQWKVKVSESSFAK